MRKIFHWTRVALVLAGLLVAAPGGDAAPKRVDYWDLLSTDTVGGRAFIEAHPQWDGRGVVVAVLDTGVDMSVPGLTTLPEGGVKVIEARDFTGQGRVKLRRPKEKDEGKEKILTTGSGVVRGHLALTPAPAQDSLLLGFLKEKQFSASSVEDINENGKTDDVFAILAGEVEIDGAKAWRIWIDRDGDGHVDDEDPVRNYAEAHEHFFLTSAPGNALRPPMAFAATLDRERRELDLHFADGSHGTHVAGIAAGYRLYDKAGYHGVAPGARVMSLKIGDNTLSGGSTRSGSMASALRFAGNWATEHDTPVVANVSYGIGTETEGTADIDRIVDGILAEYPLLSVATSAGNSGPGLSTVGTPAGADFVFSTGAVLTRDNARALYDTRISRDVLFYFSSRGGELAKPDGVAPGAAASTVPPWEWGIVMRGTSMASPQAAGCMALLASAARAAKKPLRFNGGMLRAALRNSGRALPGYTLLDQGSGVVDVGRAWRSLQRLAKEDAAWKVLGYRVRGTAPYLEDEEGPAAFFRTGTWYPTSPERISFRVRPVFLKSMPDTFRDKFFQVFDLVVEGDWLEVDKRSVYIRREESAEITVSYDPRKLRKPGIHSARIRGVYRGGGKGQDNTAFELWNTVIVPHVFDLTQGFTRSFEKQRSEPGEVQRWFVRVPEGAAAMHVRIAPQGGYTHTRLALFDPRGAEVGTLDPMADSSRGRTARARVSGDALVPGVWEIVANTHYEARKTSTFDVHVAFSGFHWETPDVIDYEMGEQPRGFLTLRSTLDEHFRGRAEGEVSGLWRKTTHTIEGDELSVPITLDDDTELVTIELSMDARTYARFTDVAVTVVDENGQVVEKEGFSMRKTRLTVLGPAGGGASKTFTLNVIGAFAGAKQDPWELEVVERIRTKDRAPLEIWCEGYTGFQLYPGQEKSCTVEISKVPRTAPEGYLHDGEVRLRDDTGRGIVLTFPLRFRIND